ncbi:hypothetical protein [Enterococcus dispar]|uniref:hypothetical protein n=1 Tax=Enterococcus dispar TaxID=44009 RepID=UPI002330B7CD|nr:hypothetical protein [Enterococcus dispar]WCG32973.1 hypothetical protein PML78_12395 [Enterococcus dispar]
MKVKERKDEIYSLITQLEVFKRRVTGQDKSDLEKQIQMYLEELEELDNRDEDEYFEQ